MAGAIIYTMFIFEVVLPEWTTRRLLLLALPFVLLTVGKDLWPVRQIIYAYLAFLWFYAWTIIIVGRKRMIHHMGYLRREYSNIAKIAPSWLQPVFVFAIAGQLTWLFTS